MTEKICALLRLLQICTTEYRFVYEWTFDTLAANSGSMAIHPTQGTQRISNIRIPIPDLINSSIKIHTSFWFLLYFIRSV